MIYREDKIEIENETSDEVLVNGGGEFTTTVTVSETLTHNINVSAPRQITEDEAAMIVEDLYES